MPQCAPSICLNTRCKTHGPSGIWRTIVPNRGRTCKTKSPASTQSRTSGVYTTTLSPHLRLSLAVTTHSSRRPYGKSRVILILEVVSSINRFPFDSPMWEDAANKQGGRWVITLNKSSKNDLDNLWLDVVSILCLLDNFIFIYESLLAAAVLDWRSIRSFRSDLWSCC